MFDAITLRILKNSFFGEKSGDREGLDSPVVNKTGKALLASQGNPPLLLQSLLSVVVSDKGVSNFKIFDVLKLFRLLLLLSTAIVKAF